MRWRKIAAVGAAVVALAVGILWVNAWSVLGWMQESRDGSAEVGIRHLRGTVL